MSLLDKLMVPWPTVAKIGKFLHLVEDDMGHLSLSGIQLWFATYVNIATLWSHMDWKTQVVAAGTNGVAGALHAVKRGQTLSVAKPDEPEVNWQPPWTGEAD